MDKSQVDALPGGQQHFLTVTESALLEIDRLANQKPQGAFRIRVEVEPQRTNIFFEWDDQFGPEDYIITVEGREIVMDATSIAIILDEYTLNFESTRFTLLKNADGPIRHQQKK